MACFQSDEDLEGRYYAEYECPGEDGMLSHSWSIINAKEIPNEEEMCYRHRDIPSELIEHRELRKSVSA